jgi:hypothetical protein
MQQVPVSNQEMRTRDNMQWNYIRRCPYCKHELKDEEGILAEPR